MMFKITHLSLLKVHRNFHFSPTCGFTMMGKNPIPFIYSGFDSSNYSSNKIRKAQHKLMNIVCQNLKDLYWWIYSIFFNFLGFIPLVFWLINYLSYLYSHLMANIWETTKNKIKKVGISNSSLGYLITTTPLKKILKLQKRISFILPVC